VQRERKACRLCGRCSLPLKRVPMSVELGARASRDREADAPGPSAGSGEGVEMERAWAEVRGEVKRQGQGGLRAHIADGDGESTGLLPGRWR